MVEAGTGTGLLLVVTLRSTTRVILIVVPQVLLNALLVATVLGTLGTRTLTVAPLLFYLT